MAPKMKRPAAMPVRVRPLRRPARAVGEEETEASKPVTEEYHPLASLTLDTMKKLEIVELGETSYYGGHAKIAGRIQSLKPTEEEVEFELSGTLTDRVLERFGGGSSRVVKVHACPAGCPQLMTGDAYFYARGYWDTTVAPKPWHTNLVPAKGAVEEEVDELAGLRELAVERGKGRGGTKPPKDEKQKEKSKSPAEEVEKKGKKRKRKERASEREYDEMLAKKEEEEELERGQKTARALFSNTCLDPNVPRRKRLMKKARRVSKKKDKKKKKSDSGDSGTSTSSSSESEKGSEEEGPLFEETRCPGALTAQAIENVREHLLSSRGELHSVSREQLSPLFSMYAHQHLQALASPVLWQELVTVAQVSDLLLRRKVATALDALVQRAKSLEATLRGGHFSASRQLELVNAEQIRIAEPAEQVEAAKSARDEFRNRSRQPDTPGQGWETAAASQAERRRKQSAGMDRRQRQILAEEELEVLRSSQNACERGLRLDLKPSRGDALLTEPTSPASRQKSLRRACGEKESSWRELSPALSKSLGVLSKTTRCGQSTEGIFPLPLPGFLGWCDECDSVLEALVRGLNSLYGVVTLQPERRFRRSR